MSESLPEAIHPVVIYRTAICPYCHMAARLLQRKGVPFLEVSLDGDASKREALQERTQWQTVPQIFVHGSFVGGYTDLAALDRTGELDRRLAAGPSGGGAA